MSSLNTNSNTNLQTNQYICCWKKFSSVGCRGFKKHRTGRSRRRKMKERLKKTCTEVKFQKWLKKNEIKYVFLSEVNYVFHFVSWVSFELDQITMLLKL